MFPESWFVVQVAPRAEKRVAEYLTYKGYRCFLPLYKTRRNWSDRKKVLELPLFPGYVFCRLLERSAGLVLATPGTVRIIGVGGKPCPVSACEIEALQRVVSSDVQASPYSPFLKIGEKVEIKNGPLAGLVGIIINIQNQHRLVLSVDLVMKSISVDIDTFEVARYVPQHEAFAHQEGALVG